MECPDCNEGMREGKRLYYCINDKCPGIEDLGYPYQARTMIEKED